MKKVLVMLILFLICFSAFGAGNQENNSENGDITLRFSWWGGDTRHQATLAAIKLYEERNPGVSIEAEYSGWDGYYQKLVTQLAGGTAPDIMQIDQPWLFELSSRSEVFQSLTNNSGLDLSGFDGQFLKEFCSYNEALKGLPTGLNGEILFLDGSVLDKAGISRDVKWDWDTIVSEGSKVNKADDSMYFLNLGPTVFTYLLEKYLSQKGGSVVNEDKSLGFSEKDAVEAFTYFQSWIDQKIIPPFSEIVLYNRKGEENPAWLNSKMASIHTWTSNLDKIRGVKTDTMVYSLPVMKNSLNSGIMVRPSQLLTVNVSSEASSEAIKFLDFFFNDEEALALLGTARGVPPTESARTFLKDEGMLDPQVDEGTAIALSVLGKPQTIWQMNTEVRQIMDDIVEQFGFGVLTPKEAARQLITKMEDKLSTL